MQLTQITDALAAEITDTVNPEDSIYSASDYYDFRDWSWLGKCPSIKISELRRRWGKEFNPSNPLAILPLM